MREKRSKKATIERRQNDQKEAINEVQSKSKRKTKCTRATDTFFVSVCMAVASRPFAVSISERNSSALFVSIICYHHFLFTSSTFVRFFFMVFSSGFCKSSILLLMLCVILSQCENCRACHYRWCVTIQAISLSFEFRLSFGMT